MERYGGIMFNPFTDKTTRPMDSAALDQDSSGYNFKDHWIPIVAASVVLLFAVIIVAGIVLILS